MLKSIIEYHGRIEKNVAPMPARMGSGVTFFSFCLHWTADSVMIRLKRPKEKAGFETMEYLKSLREQLCEQYKYRIEMHAHTLPISRCSELWPEDMAKIHAQKGYHGVVLANHFIYEEMQGMTREEAVDRYIGNYEEVKAAGEKYGVKVFLAAEIRFTENTNDYLVYGVNRDILLTCYDYLPKGVECFRKEVKLPNSLFIQAHPFRNGCVAVAPELLDGVETLNMHPHHNSRVGLALKFAKENQINITVAGTDLHHPNQKHEAVSGLRSRFLPEDTFDIVKMLRAGDYIFELGEQALVLP